MSRSYRRHPIRGLAADSDKDDKRRARKVWRRRCRQLISVTPVEELEDLILPALREVSSVWCFAKDGKVYWAPISVGGASRLFYRGEWTQEAYDREVIRRKKSLGK